jgi:hypothetical protein
MITVTKSVTTNLSDLITFLTKRSGDSLIV